MRKISASGHGQERKDAVEPVPALTPRTVAVEPNPVPGEHGHGPHIEFKFLDELRKRNVVRVALLYLVVCWLILEPTHVVFHMLEVPAWANRLVLMLMALGLPAVAVFAWAFEITPEGLKPTVQVDPRESIRPLTGRRLDRAIMVVMALAIAYFVADKFWLSKRLPAATSEQTSAQGATLPSATPQPMPTAADDKSIAVLPFVNMSADKEQEYFSDGLTEELINHLAHASDLKVIARTSSFQFKGRNEDMRTIATKLGVAHLLEGSVRRSRKELRITAQLIRASDGSQIWSQTYDRSLNDIFKVQNEIAGTVALALKTALSASAIGPSDAASVDAYNIVLKGNFMWHRGNKGDMQLALALYQEATKVDPNYAPAWAKLADAYHNLGYSGQISVADAKSAGLKAVRRALSIDPNLAEAHMTLGEIHCDFDWDFKAAKAEQEKALELDPNNLAFREDLGILTWMATGNADGYIEAERQRIMRNPVDARALYTLGDAYFDAHRFRESADALAKALELSPGAEAFSSEYAGALLFMGQYDKALAAAEREPNEEFRLGVLPCIYWKLGRHAESDAALEELKKKYGQELDAYAVGQMHTCRGETKAALDWLERAYAQHQAGLPFMKFDRYLLDLHKEPRFRDLLVKLKLLGDTSDPSY